MSWSAQYPKAVYKSTKVAQDSPEVAPFPQTTWPLAWNKPWTWLRVGRQVRSADVLILVTVTPYHAVPYRVLLSCVGRRPRRVALMHNVLPHEAGPVDRVLIKLLIKAVDRVMVHGQSQEQEAGAIGARPEQILSAPLPPHPPGRDPLDQRSTTWTAPAESSEPALLFFGIVRPYKGLDLLLRAMAEVPGVRLLVAGQFWEDVEIYRALIAELGIGARVELRPGYVAAKDIEKLIASCSALALPYRSATSSQMVHTAFQHGRPVLVTDVGELATGVTDGVDGVVVPTPTVDGLITGLKILLAPGKLAQMAAAVTAEDRTDAAWDRYLDVLTSRP